MKSLLLSFSLFFFLSSSLVAVSTEKKNLEESGGYQDSLEISNDSAYKKFELDQKMRQLMLRKSRSNSDEMLAQMKEKRAFFKKKKEELKEWEEKMQVFYEKSKTKLEEVSCQNQDLQREAEKPSTTIFTEEGFQIKMEQYELFKQCGDEAFFRD